MFFVEHKIRLGPKNCWTTMESQGRWCGRLRQRRLGQCSKGTWRFVLRGGWDWRPLVLRKALQIRWNMMKYLEAFGSMLGNNLGQFLSCLMSCVTMNNDQLPANLCCLTALGLKIFARGDQCSRAERHGGLSRQAPNQASWIQSHPRSTSFFSQVSLKDIFFLGVLSLNCPGKPAVAETKAPPKQRDSSTIKKDIKVGCILLHGLPDRTVLVFVASGWWYRLCTVHHWEYRKDSRPLPDGLTLMTSYEIICLDL